MSGPPSYPSFGHSLGTPGVLTVVDVENAVGSRLAMAELGLAPPLSIARRYRVVRLLGRGARGVVCQASDQNLHRDVALKLYPALEPGPAAQEVALEAQALARLRHPNVVGVYDFGDTALTLDGYPPLHVPCFFMTMEHIAGQSMRRWLSVGAPDHDQVLAAFHQAGAGLAHAHECGVVHRDVKPDNIVIAHDGRALVVDFGLARHRSGTQAPVIQTTALALWQPLMIAGTPEYMAPEARLGQADASSDQYGFALSLYEALLGSLPATSSAGMPIVQLERLPQGLAGVLARALQPDARRRYPSMRALLDELPTRWSDPSVIESAASADAMALVEPRPRRGLAVVGVVALVIGWLGLAAWWTGREQGAAAQVWPREAVERARVGLGASTGGAMAGDCPELALIGDWRFKTQIWWDYKLRDAEWPDYRLTLRQGSGCQLIGSLTRNSESIGEEVLQVRHRDAREGVELRATWPIYTREHIFFHFVFREDQLLGDYVRTQRYGRPTMKGPVHGGRVGRPMFMVTEHEQLPCRSQCRLLCAGAEATQRCEDQTCLGLDSPLADCGPPSADFQAPRSCADLLTEVDRGVWQPVSSGEPCEQVVPVLEGTWTLHERRDAGELVEWKVALEPTLACTLTGTATTPGETRNVLVELDKDGQWLLSDPRDPERMRWAMYGWEFAVGLATGRRPARIRGQRDLP